MIPGAVRGEANSLSGLDCHPLVPGGPSVHVQPHRGHRRPHHAQGLRHCRVARQPRPPGVPGLDEVRGEGSCCPGLGVELERGFLGRLTVPS